MSGSFCVSRAPNFDINVLHCAFDTDAKMATESIPGFLLNWKTWKMGRHFPVREKSENFEQTGKVREIWENHSKYWKIQGILKKCNLLFLVIFKLTVYYLLKWMKFSVKKTKTLKEYWKMEKNIGKVKEFFQSGKVGTMYSSLTQTQRYTL